MLSRVLGAVPRTWPAVVFLSIARAVSSRAARSRSRLATARLCSAVGAGAARAALVQLSVPLPGAGRMETLFSNDQILAKVVKDTSDVIYVKVVTPESHRKDMTALKFISETYSRLWDEMVHNNKLSLKCVVFHDEASTATTRRLQLSQASPAIEVIYVAAGAAHSSDDALRQDLALPAARVERVAFSGDCEGMWFVDCEEQPLPQFKKVALGGTFDRLHNGHRKLLSIGCGVCTETLVIGLMGDQLLKAKSNSDMIHPYADRYEQVHDYVSVVKPDLRAIDIVELSDPFGPALSDPAVEAIVVSSETVAGANKINSLRKEKGFCELKVVVIRRSDVATLSSTFLRGQSTTPAEI